jgi:hypothetical protein
MRRRSRWARLACGAGCLFFAGAMPLLAESPTFEPPAVWTGIGPPPDPVPPCDQYDPLSPAPSGRITLDSRDLMHRGGSELRSFIETGSTGRVGARLVGATPSGVVLSVSARPEISRISPDFGERLKGVALDVTLASAVEPVRVVVDVQQVCARHFRNTFLYY